MLEILQKDLDDELGLFPMSVVDSMLVLGVIVEFFVVPVEAPDFSETSNQIDLVPNPIYILFGQYTSCRSKQNTKLDLNTYSNVSKYIKSLISLPSLTQENCISARVAFPLFSSALD